MSSCKVTRFERSRERGMDTRKPRQSVTVMFKAWADLPEHGAERGKQVLYAFASESSLGNYRCRAVDALVLSNNFIYSGARTNKAQLFFRSK